MRGKTLKSTLSIKGKGIHTGEEARVTIHPSTSGKIEFKKNGVTIPASIDYIVSSEHGTDIGKDGIVIKTIEHLMSAIVGAGLTSLLIEVEGIEIPILDGSSLPFIQMFIDAGFEEINLSPPPFGPKRPLTIKSEGSLIQALPFDGFSVTYVVSYPHPQLYMQFHTFDSMSRYREEIAPARTFGILEWADELREKGLVKGASIENILLYNKNGHVNEPRFKNEVARHKILDFIGDIGLLSTRPEGYYFIIKGGHKLHLKLAETLGKEVNGAV